GGSKNRLFSPRDWYARCSTHLWTTDGGGEESPPRFMGAMKMAIAGTFFGEQIMKRMFIILAAATPLLTANLLSGSDGITGSKHDFSSDTWSDSQICKPCHTPHNAIAPELTGRIWAHTLSTATYTLHGSSVTGEGTRLD